ncbi:hypothetical protein D3C85_1161490 [compost metagenome]
MGIFTLFYVHAYRFTCFIELKFNFGTLKADGTVFKLTIAKNVSQFIQFQYFDCVIAGFVFNYFLGFFIGESPVGMDYCSAIPFILDVCLLIELKNSCKAEFVFVRAK